MKILAIETSSKKLSLAVLEDLRVLFYSNEALGYKLSELIISRIDRILKKAGIPLNKIDGIAVGLGPGSFTGLRVGLSTAKGLCFSTNKPIVGISSLDTLALSVPLTEALVCSVSDAKRERVYVSRYDKNASNIKQRGDYQLIKVDEFVKQGFDNTVFVGDGIPLIIDQVSKMAKNVIFADERKWVPQAGNLGTLAYERFKKKQYSDIDRLTPLYLYSQDCQVRK